MTGDQPMTLLMLKDMQEKNLYSQGKLASSSKKKYIVFLEKNEN